MLGKFHNYIFIWLVYIIFTGLATIFKRLLTIKGLFYSFVTILGCFLVTLLWNFDTIIYKQSIFFWETTLVQNSGNMLELAISIKVDMLSYLFMLLVVCIGFFTNIYTLSYFKYEAKETTFYVMLNWFILSMLLFVAAENGFTLFLGWELIGLTSFFLINFWTDRRGTFKASFKAFSFNKVSDVLLLIFLLILWQTLGHTKFSLVHSDLVTNPHCATLMLKYATIALILCAGIKSAQLVAHSWLPDSMEAPVPASALIHSATLVSAGVYLLLRFSGLTHLFELESLILIWGSLTAVYGGVVAAAQTDVKKLLAYSTISHCGFLFVCVGLRWVWLTICYLYLHGLFKALTFFCVGSFIRISRTQDTRWMGIYGRIAPVDTLLLMICAGNLGGLPFTLGFFYKKFFLAILFSQSTNYLVLACCTVGMLTSIVYVYRLVYYVAFDVNKGSVSANMKFLQNHERKINDYWSATTPVHLIAVVGMLLTSGYLYQLLVTTCVSLNISFQQDNLYWESSSNIIQASEYAYEGYYFVFYTIYLLIFMVVWQIDWRYSYSHYYKVHFFIFIVFFFLVFALLTTLIKDINFIFEIILEFFKK